MIIWATRFLFYVSLLTLCKWLVADIEQSEVHMGSKNNYCQKTSKMIIKHKKENKKKEKEKKTRAKIETWQR